VSVFVGVKDSRDTSLLEPELRKRYLLAVEDYSKKYFGEPSVIVTSTYRSLERQRELYEQGRTTPGNIVTNVLEGMHNQTPALALDIAFNTAGGGYSRLDLFEKFAECFKPYGVIWGGDWKSFPDRPHFEAPISIDDFKAGKPIPWPPIRRVFPTPFQRVFVIEGGVEKQLEIERMSIVGDKLYIAVKS
jgi:hypothetical protein